MSEEGVLAEIVLKDGVRYVQHAYENEKELEEIVAEHVTEIFGPAALLFPKKKLKSRSGIGSIPDAFVIDMDGPQWLVVEVELASHPLFAHIVNQVSKFRAGLVESNTLTALKKAFYDEITDDPDKKVMFEKRGVTEVYKFVSDTLETKPTVRLIIDRESHEQIEVMGALPFETGSTELRTYYRDGNVSEDHVHRFIPVLAARPAPPPKPPPGPPPPPPPPVSYKFAEPVAYALWGKRTQVTTFREILLGVCQQVHERHKTDFSEKVLSWQGSKQKYFSRDPQGLRSAKKIPETSIYVGAKLSANGVVRRCRRLLELFGHGASPDYS